MPPIIPLPSSTPAQIEIEKQVANMLKSEDEDIVVTVELDDINQFGKYIEESKSTSREETEP